MSRLHEAKSKGLGAVPSEPHWASIYPTMADRADDLYRKATPSARRGTRKTRTMRKTARALGHDFQDPRPWKTRHHDITSAKSQKQRGLKKAVQAAKETARGDRKKA